MSSSRRKKKERKKIAFHFLVIFFQYHPANVQSRWPSVNSMETCSQVASRRPESTSFATLPRIAHVLFFNSAAIQFTVSYHCEPFSLCCAMPRTYDLDMTILWSRSGNFSTHRWTIDKNKDDNAWCTRFVHDFGYSQIFVFAHIVVLICALLHCNPFLYTLFFFFFYFFFRLEFLLRIIIIIIEMYFFRIIIWLLISVGFTLLYDYLTYDNLW